MSGDVHVRACERLEGRFLRATRLLVLCKSARKAEQALELSEQVLHDLRLEFNPRKTAIVNFERGFRFLGVRFIRSLAFKETFPDDPLDIGADGQADAPAGKPVDDAQTRPDRSRVVKRRRAHVEPVSEMEQAFRDAGISPEQFPSEPALPEPLDPPRDDDLPAGGDPRLKTLYVLGHGLVLGKESERFTIRDKGRIIREIPAIHVDHIMVYGYSQITTQAMHFCLTQRIPVYLLSGGGRYYGVIDSFDTEPVLLHRDQFGTADDPEFCLKLARQFLRGKISNSRLVLLRHSRHRDLPRFEQAAAELKRAIAGLDAAATLNHVRGIEGNAARAYFQGIAETVDPAWGFNGRVKQPPTDPVNSLLSYGYTLLFYNIYSLLRCRGLNPHVGYLHPLRAGHPALASDMIEEFRAIIVDAVVLNLVFNRKLTPADFDLPDQPDRACLLKPDARKHFIRHLEAKLNAPIRHPVSGERVDYRRCLAHQISHLAAVIRGAADNYQPMVLR